MPPATRRMKIQVACTIYGQLAWISDPVNGSRRGNYGLSESGILLTLNPADWIGDKGCIGNEMITFFKKPAGGELFDWQKEFNSQVNKILWIIEQVISRFKNWRIVNTDYRRPIDTFATTISAVIDLHLPNGLNKPHSTQPRISLHFGRIPRKMSRNVDTYCRRSQT